jgi:hypothetical protein
VSAVGTVHSEGDVHTNRLHCLRNSDSELNLPFSCGRAYYLWQCLGLVTSQIELPTQAWYRKA